MSRYTLKREISFRGVGLHSGTPVSMRLLPAGSGEGYVFLFGGKRFPIQAAKHSGDGRGTILAFDSNRVMTALTTLSFVPKESRRRCSMAAPLLSARRS